MYKMFSYGSLMVQTLILKFFLVYLNSDFIEKHLNTRMHYSAGTTDIPTHLYLITHTFNIRTLLGIHHSSLRQHIRIHLQNVEFLHAHKSTMLMNSRV